MFKKKHKHIFNYNSKTLFTPSVKLYRTGGAFILFPFLFSNGNVPSKLPAYYGVSVFYLKLILNLPVSVQVLQWTEAVTLLI